jgi:HlyD family secretion protein
MVVGLLGAMGAGYFALQSSTQPARDAAKAALKEAQPKAKWLATAPGRVEPRGGEIKMATAVAGRIVDVSVKVNDAVTAGQVLLRIDDADAEARLAAAEAEVAARRRERDTETVTGPALDRRRGEDAVAAAERGVFASRQELDRLLAARASGGATAEAISNARQALARARTKLDEDKAALRRTLAAATNLPLLTRLEAGLAAARADLLAAEAAFERTRIRAPVDATVLQVAARLGEIAAPSPENTLLVLGDLTALRVRAEIEERDVGKVHVGQRVGVRSDSTGEREFEGKISIMAQALGPPRLGPRGPRRPNDVDVLEIVVDLDGTPPLLSGMRVDVYVRPDATVDNGKAAPAAKATH